MVYTPDGGAVDGFAAIGRIFGSPPIDVAAQLSRFANYTAELRYTLADADQRLYAAERYCDRGWVQNWIWIGGPAPLEALAQKLLPHLGEDSFYELF